MLALLAAQPVRAQLELLEPEQAFQFTARPLNPNTVEARFIIADGYYLYRDKIRFNVKPSTAGLVPPTLPTGKMKEDEFFGRVETYRDGIVVTLALKNTAPGQRIVVEAESQGCADVGVCYPPNVQHVTLALPAANAAPTAPETPPKKVYFN